MFSLVRRHNKVFYRDKTQVFFSVLSILIIIALYGIFLQQMQIDAIEQVTASTPAVVTMVNEWLVAGLLSMIAVTTTLGAFGILVQDLESKASVDFLTTPMSRAKLQLSYVVHAFVIGLTFTLLALVACQLFLVYTGGNWLPPGTLLHVLWLLVLSVALASTFNLFIVQFIQSQSAFSMLSTILGTLLGFLCGIFIPLGVLPSFTQQIIMAFPISHTTVLLRDAFMQDSITNVFAGAPREQIDSYLTNYGVIYQADGVLMQTSTSYLIIIATIISLAIASVLYFKWRNK